MSLLHVLTLPSPVLRQIAQPVPSITDDIKKLMRDMLETMYATHGIGLAANQIGHLKRIITIDISEKPTGTSGLMMANPEIIWKSEETFTYNEGCLSVRPVATESAPDLYADVTRPKKIRLRYLNEDGAQKEIEAEDLFSQCIQHEIDHLNGVLFIDHISPLKRKMMLRKIDKRQKSRLGDEDTAENCTL